MLERIQRGEIRLVSRDTAEPSPLAHEILNARPYAFLDDAPLEERRTQAVYARRASEPAALGDLGTLDAAAIEQVRDEARPDPRDADELHDALLTAGFLTEPETSALAADLFAPLVAMRRAARVNLPSDRPAERSAIHVAAERLPEILAVHPNAAIEGDAAPPPSRAARTWSRGEALVAVEETILGAGHAVGAVDPSGAGRADGRPDHLRHRLPALHHLGRRPDPGAA